MGVGTKTEIGVSSGQVSSSSSEISSVFQCWGEEKMARIIDLKHKLLNLNIN